MENMKEGDALWMQKIKRIEKLLAQQINAFYISDMLLHN